MSIANSSPPAVRFISPDSTTPSAASEARASTRPSRRNAFLSTAITPIEAAMPRMSRMFPMLDPTTLPTAIPGEPMEAAWSEVTSSGAEVPKPTRVRPMTMGDSPAARATATEPRTRNSPPMSRPIRPTATSTKSSIWGKISGHAAGFARCIRAAPTTDGYGKGGNKCPRPSAMKINPLTSPGGSSEPAQSAGRRR